jgi:hypothetical protein
MATSGKSERIGFESHLPCGIFPLTGWALRLGRRSAAVQEEFSGDRDELLPPPMKGQSGISAGVETFRDGGVAPTYKVP